MPLLLRAGQNGTKRVHEAACQSPSRSGPHGQPVLPGAVQDGRLCQALFPEGNSRNLKLIGARTVYADGKKR